MRLFDLIEGRWNPQINSFVKVATHKTNVPYAICASEKKKREPLGVSRAHSQRFIIVPNGALQYKNTFLNLRK